MKDTFKYKFKCKCLFSLSSFKETHLLWFRFLWHMCFAKHKNFYLMSCRHPHVRLVPWRTPTKLLWSLCSPSCLSHYLCDEFQFIDIHSTWDGIGMIPPKKQQKYNNHQQSTNQHQASINHVDWVGCMAQVETAPTETYSLGEMHRSTKRLFKLSKQNSNSRFYSTFSDVTPLHWIVLSLWTATIKLHAAHRSPAQTQP